MKHFYEVVDHAGGCQALANAVNKLLPATARPLSRQSVRQWLRRDQDVPAEYCLPIAHLYPVAPAVLNPNACFHLAPRVAA